MDAQPRLTKKALFLYEKVGQKKNVCCIINVLLDLLFAVEPRFRTGVWSTLQIIIKEPQMQSRRITVVPPGDHHLFDVIIGNPA